MIQPGDIITANVDGEVMKGVWRIARPRRSWAFPRYYRCRLCHHRIPPGTPFLACRYSTPKFERHLCAECATDNLTEHRRPTTRKIQPSWVK